MELGLGLWGTGVWIPGLWRYAPRSLPLPACVAGARPIDRSLNSDCWTHVVDSHCPLGACYNYTLPFG